MRRNTCRDKSFTQVYVGGDINGRITLQDDTDTLNNDNFVMHPGATLEAVCDTHSTALHFTGTSISHLSVVSLNRLSLICVISPRR